MKVTRCLDISAVMGLLLALGWFNPGNAGGTDWADPHGKWDQFAAWCCEQGGCPDQPTSSCKPAGSSCSHPCGGSVSGSTHAPVIDHRAIERAREEKAFREKHGLDKIVLDRVEDENERREKNREYWTEKRRKALADRLKPAVDEIFSKEKAAELAAKSQAEVTKEAWKVWTQLHCSHSITGKVMKAAKVGDGYAVKYLNDQAEKATAGRKLGIRCPPASALRAPYGKDSLGSTSRVARLQRDLRAKAFNKALEIEKMRREREQLWEKLRKDLGSKELEEATKHLIAEHVKALRSEKEEGKAPETKPEPAEPAPIPEEKTEEKIEEKAEEKAEEETEKKKKSRQALIKAIAALQFAEDVAGEEVDSYSEASQNAFENPDSVDVKD